MDFTPIIILAQLAKDAEITTIIAFPHERVGNSQAVDILFVYGEEDVQVATMTLKVPQGR